MDVAVNKSEMIPALCPYYLSWKTDIAVITNVLGIVTQKYRVLYKGIINESELVQEIKKCLLQEVLGRDLSHEEEKGDLMVGREKNLQIFQKREWNMGMNKGFLGGGGKSLAF